MNFVQTVVQESNGKQQVKVDRCYPFDERLGWERVAPLTEQMAYAIVGLDPAKTTPNSFLNKGYVVYAVDYDRVFAVYLHDWNFSIIACDLCDYERRYAKGGDDPLSRMLDPATGELYDYTTVEATDDNL